MTAPCTVRVGDGICGVAVGPDGRHWPRATAANPTLPHQIILRRGLSLRTYVTCNCLVRARPSGRDSKAAVLGYYKTLAGAWALYNAHLPAAEQAES